MSECHKMSDAELEQAVDEMLHASARTNSLDNISVVLIAFDPLV